MKKLFALITMALLTCLAAEAKVKKQARTISSTETAIKVCGELQIDEEDNKIIVDQATQKSYMLIIDEVAQPKGMVRDLINYESKVYQKLRAGKSYCALGLLGASTESAQLSFLVQFSIISSR